MPNRSKVSKQIRRRTGGYNKTGKGTTVAAINRMRDEWEDDPDFKGTPTPYNIRKKVRKKKKKAKSPNPMGIRITPKKTKRAGTNVVGADTRPKPKRGRRRQPTEGGVAIGSFTRRVGPDLSHVKLPPATKPSKAKRYSETPVHMMDPIESDIERKRREAQAQRDAARRAGKRGPSRMPAFKSSDTDEIARILDKVRQMDDDASVESRLSLDELRRKRIKEATGNRKGGTIKRKGGGKPKKHRGCGKALRGFGAVSKG